MADHDRIAALEATVARLERELCQALGRIAAVETRPVTMPSPTYIPPAPFEPLNPSAPPWQWEFTPCAPSTTGNDIRCNK